MRVGKEDHRLGDLQHHRSGFLCDRVVVLIAVAELFVCYAVCAKVIFAVERSIR